MRLCPDCLNVLPACLRCKTCNGEGYIPDLTEDEKLLEDLRLLEEEEKKESENLFTRLYTDEDVA